MSRAMREEGSGGIGALGLFALGVYVFLYLPVVTMVVMSFNDSVSPGLPWGGFTTRWYSHSLNNTVALRAFLNSVQIGIVVSIVSTTLGLGVALASRRAFRGKGLLLNALIMPLLIPGIVLGVGQITLWNVMGFLPGLWGSTLLGHLVYTVPFAFINIFPRVHRFDPNIEAAAADLGAGPWTVFRTVLLPIIMPGVVASLLFCFTLSFDEFTRTLFLIGADNTLPIYFWSIILTDPSPAANALATLSLLFSLSVAGIGLYFITRRGRAPAKAAIPVPVPAAVPAAVPAKEGAHR